MSDRLHNELKKEFQLERMILFSDAVFAIAITLLIIEIKVPEIPSALVTDDVLLKALGHLVPKFMGYLISFMLIGLYWTIHHRMFGFVTGYDRRLIRLNLVFLFFIALMPFSTGFYSEYAGSAMFRKGLKVPMTFYVLNFAAAGFIIHFLWQYISHRSTTLTDRPIDPIVLQQAKARSLIVPCIFLSMLPVAYLVNVGVAVYMPVFIPILTRMINKRIANKYGSTPKSLE